MKNSGNFDMRKHSTVARAGSVQSRASLIILPEINASVRIMRASLLWYSDWTFIPLQIFGRCIWAMD